MSGILKKRLCVTPLLPERYLPPNVEWELMVQIRPLAALG